VGVASETTAAAAGEVGKLRHDPFAMLPFCGYNMGDYFRHWFSVVRDIDPKKVPRIFYVNWFLKGKSGEWLWPGFGENSRVLKWIFDRIDGRADAVETPLGYVPQLDAFDISGLSISKDELEQLFYVDQTASLKDVEDLRGYLTMFGSRLPPECNQELENLKIRLKSR
jgi:phosphoenolpyruvate carboxykinase (GTP)